MTAPTADPTPTRQAWTVATVLAITCHLSYGILYYTFSVFLSPMEQELGWTRAQSSLGISLALITSGLIAPLLGRWVDRQGPRFTMALGSVLGSLLVYLWSGVQNLTQFYLLWATMGLAWGAVFYDVAFTAIAQWFQQKRHQALLLVTLVAGTASTVFIPLSTHLLHEFGWRDTLKVLSLVLAAGTILPHLLLLRPAPPQPAPSAQQAETTTHPPLPAQVFWWLTLSFALSFATVLALVAHLVPMLTEKGFSPATVALAAGMVGLMALPGRALFAPLTEKVSTLRLTQITLVLQGVGFFCLLLPGNVGLWLFVVLVGSSNGAFTIARASLVAELYGPTGYGQITGKMGSWAALTKALLPALLGVLYLQWHSYRPLLLLLGGLGMLSALGIWQVGRILQQVRKTGPAN